MTYGEKVMDMTFQYDHMEFNVDSKLSSWNNIPVEIRSSPSAFSFRRKLKAFLFENNYQQQKCNIFANLYQL